MNFLRLLCVLRRDTNYYLVWVIFAPGSALE